jgi:hypothetical protein
MSGEKLAPTAGGDCHGLIIKWWLVLVTEKGERIKKRLESVCNLGFIYSNSKV